MIPPDLALETSLPPRLLFLSTQRRPQRRRLRLPPRGSPTPSACFPSSFSLIAAFGRLHARNRPRKSSPSVGLIVGVTFAATAAFALALGLLLFCVRRRRRARNRVKELEIEPAWADSAVSPATANAVTIEPYIAASS